jgi:hypothetical protein
MAKKTKGGGNRMPPFQRHSSTSRLAALMLYETSGEKRMAVLALLRSIYPSGCTDDEGRAALGMHPNTYRPRRIELVQAGLVEELPNTRLSEARRPMHVWRAVPTENWRPESGG